MFTKHYVTVRFFALTFIFAFVAISSVGHATTYYVGTTGSNANTCTQARNQSAPKQTIADGISCLSSGDTLQVMAGTYPGQQITDPPGGTPSAYTIIRNFPGDRPKITSANQFDRGLYLTRGSVSSYIEVRGFEFSGVYDGAKFHGDDTIGFPHHIRFVDNKVHHTVGTGMLIASQSNGTDGGDHLIQGNEFYQIGIGTPGYHGMNTIYNPGNRSIVEGNIFHNDTNGVGIYQGGDFIFDVIVRNNVFYDMFLSNIDTWQRGANGGAAVHVTSPGGRHQIYNNIIYRSGFEASFCGIGAYYGANDVKIYNNTIYGLLSPSAYGIYVDGSTTTKVQVKNNIVYQTGGIVGGHLVSNNTTTDPRFVNVTIGDFHLQPGSTAIDQGLVLPEVLFDFAGAQRPQGNAYDRGAYEWQSGDTQPPAPPTNVSVK